MTKYLIVLVHGTRFAHDAKWIQEGSVLWKSLVRDLGSDVQITSFPWSGANSHADRVAGAEKLSAVLKSSISRASSSKVFLICHSHGGNVALMAIREKELQQKISGVICLGTPFLHVFRRGLTNILYLPAAVGLAACLILFYPALRAVDDFQFSTAAIGVLGIFTTLFAYFLRWLSDPDRFRNVIIPSLIESINLPQIISTRISCLITASDEVFDFFSTFSSITSLALHLLRFPLPLFVFLPALALAQWLGIVPMFPGLLWMPLLGESMQAILLGQAPHASWISAIFPWLVSATLYVLGIVVLAHLAAWARLQVLGLNSVGFLTAPHVRVATTVTPLNARSCWFYEFDPKQLDSLNHSASYNDPLVIKAVIAAVRSGEASVS